MGLRLISNLAVFILFCTTAIDQIPSLLDLTFGRVTFDQILFFLTTSEGTYGTDITVVKNAIGFLFVIPFFVASVFYVFLNFLISFKNLTAKEEKIAKINLYFLIAALLAFLAYTMVTTFDYLGGFGFFKKNNGPDVFSELYTEAHIPEGEEKKRNLILLHVESLELTFSDKEKFGVDLNEPLHKFFDHPPMSVRPASGTTWTTAGMVAAQCGVPLAPFIWNKAELKSGPILSKAKCISDYLALRDYEQFFYVGPDLKFAGMDKFYKNHGFNYSYGKDELIAQGIDKTLHTGWGEGIQDDTLLDTALAKIRSVRQQKKNYNVTIMTTDNHAPNGFLSPRCPSTSIKEPAFAKVFQCTNHFISIFLENLEKEGVFEDTVVVVMGDHLFMDNKSHAQYFKDRQKRRVFLNFIAPSSAHCPSRAIELNHFDVAPTILSLVLGKDIEKMGIGLNACLPNLEKRAKMAEKIGVVDISSQSLSYRALWEEN